MSRGLIRRALAGILAQTIATRRVTVVSGPRQSGKTTLAAQLLDDLGHGTLRSLDDEAQVRAAITDPEGFVATDTRPLVIDEVQRGGDPLVRAVKRAVDRDPAPGQFVLTGSANFLTVPGISESLAGRAAFLDLWPLTQGEMAGRSDGFVDAAFGGPERLRALSPSALETGDYLDRLCRGGYPEVQAMDARQRRRWFNDYVATVIRRDVVELSGIRKVDETHHLLALLAARTADELVMQHVVEDARLGREGVYGRVAWLETIHLVRRIPGWSRNPTSRVKRHPKLYLTDPGLAAALLGRDAAALAEPTEPAAGNLVETFAVNELWRQAAWAETDVACFHFRDRNGPEVDLVLEAPDGRVVGIEVKKGVTVTEKTFRWLALLRDRLGDRFVQGIVLCTGQDALSFGDRLTAVPLDALWRA